jgi:aspartate carbamoyltransferase catalytic subunit
MPSEEIVALLDAGQRFADLVRSGGRAEPMLAGRTVTTVFLEASSRTRLSFE